MGGFSDYFQLKKQVEITVGKTFETQQFNQPRIVLDVQNQQTDFLELSGYVEDESGITDILVFNGEDKVYYKGETGLVGKVPFAVDVGLVDGSNPIYILAKDNEGLHTSQFVQVWK
jgi:ABC-type branched-subunit amino acid transport system substrate-binding protein